MSINPISAAYAPSFVSESSRKRKSNDPWDALTEHQRREAAANRDRLGLDQLEANSMAARARVQNAEAPAATEDDEAAQGAAGHHCQTIAGKDYPLSEAPDYSTWDKEDAYCDIIKRYNLLNMLSKEKAKELGLGDAYQNMKDEIDGVLYGGNPIKMGKSHDEIVAMDSDIQQRMNRKVYCEMYGITSDEEYEQRFKEDIMSIYDPADFSTGGSGAFPDDGQIYEILSRFDLTEQKTSLISSMSIMSAPFGTRFSPFDTSFDGSGAMDVFEYIERTQAEARKQYEYGNYSQERYNAFLDWGDFVREMYSVYR